MGFIGVLFFSGISESFSGRMIRLDSCYFGRGEMFFFGKYIYFGYELYVFFRNVFVSIDICVLSNILFFVLVFYVIWFLVKEFIL